MSSNLSEIETVLVDRLSTVLPEWTIRNAESGNAKALKKVLYYEQLNVVTEVNGAQLPKGSIGTEFVLTIASSVTEPVKATREVTAALTDVLPALDQMSDLFWDTAEKARLETGETAYRITTILLTKFI